MGTGFPGLWSYLKVQLKTPFSAELGEGLSDETAVFFSPEYVSKNHSEPLHVLENTQGLKKLNLELPEGYLTKYVGVSDSAMWKELMLEFDI